MATIYRAYHTREDFRKYRIFTVHITGLVILTGLLAHFSFAVLPWLITIYLTWSPWHYSGQNYGLFMMFLRRAGAQPTPTATSCALFGFSTVLRILVSDAAHWRIRRSVVHLARHSSQTVPCSARNLWHRLRGCIVLRFNCGRQKDWRKAIIPSLTLLSSQTLWFIAPSLLALLAGLQVPQSRYSTGVLAIMHSVQYLWITTFYARKEAAAKRLAGWKPLAYFALW